MKISEILYMSAALVAVLAVYVAAEEEETKKKKLQIGIKKRVEPELCKIKSRKGDTLSMHYTVSTFHYNTIMFLYSVNIYKNVHQHFT